VHHSPGPFRIEAKSHLYTKGNSCTATDTSLAVHEESRFRRHLADGDVFQDGFTDLDGWRVRTVGKNVLEHEATVLRTDGLKI